MFSYDGYLNENYPSFIWLRFPITLISVGAAVMLYFFPDYTHLIFGIAAFLIIFFEAWLALGGKRWLLAWTLITLCPLTIALTIAYGHILWLPVLVYVLAINSFIAVDAIYYRRIITGVLSILATLFIGIIYVYYGNISSYAIAIYYIAYSLISIIDYISIIISLKKQ